MEIYYSCNVRWKIDGKNGPAWYTETWLVKAISVSDAETRSNAIASEEDLPGFECRSATPSSCKRVVEKKIEYKEEN